MPKYLVTYKQYFVATVEAEDPAAAQQHVQFEWSKAQQYSPQNVDAGGFELVGVELIEDPSPASQLDKRSFDAWRADRQRVADAIRELLRAASAITTVVNPDGSTPTPEQASNRYHARRFALDRIDDELDRFVNPSGRGEDDP